MTLTQQRYSLTDIERAAVLRRAQEYLVRVEDKREAKALKDQGKTQREIAEILQITQPRVHRLLKSVELDGGDVPVTPREQIYRAALENSSRAELINWLVSYPHTFTEYAPEPFDGSIPGTWTEVRTALLTGLLSQEEYDQIAEKVHPPVSA